MTWLMNAVCHILEPNVDAKNENPKIGENPKKVYIVQFYMTTNSLRLPLWQLLLQVCHTPEGVIVDYEYWVYCDHHLVVKNKKDQEKGIKQERWSTLGENCRWNSLISLSTRRKPRCTRTSLKTGTYHFKRKDDFDIEFLVHMEEDSESSACD